MFASVAGGGPGPRGGRSPGSRRLRLRGCRPPGRRECFRAQGRNSSSLVRRGELPSTAATTRGAPRSRALLQVPRGRPSPALGGRAHPCNDLAVDVAEHVREQAAPGRLDLALGLKLRWRAPRRHGDGVAGGRETRGRRGVGGALPGGSRRSPAAAPAPRASPAGPWSPGRRGCTCSGSGDRGSSPRRPAGHRALPPPPASSPRRRPVRGPRRGPLGPERGTQPVSPEPGRAAAGAPGLHGPRWWGRGDRVGHRFALPRRWLAPGLAYGVGDTDRTATYGVKGSPPPAARQAGLGCHQQRRLEASMTRLARLVIGNRWRLAWGISSASPCSASPLGSLVFLGKPPTGTPTTATPRRRGPRPGSAAPAHRGRPGRGLPKPAGPYPSLAPPALRTPPPRVLHDAVRLPRSCPGGGCGLRCLLQN